jgi:hypothetical protein
MPLWPFLLILALAIGWLAWETRRVERAVAAYAHEVRCWQELLAMTQVPHQPTKD